MGKRNYRQLCLNERIEIYRLYADGKSLRKIAELLGRSPATISRELRRNAKSTKQYNAGYQPARAQELTIRRRKRGCPHKLTRQPELLLHVKNRLVMGWSPEQISARLTLDNHRLRISHEAIYRYIYYRLHVHREKLHRLLSRKKYRRGHNSHRLPRRTIPHRISLHDRPKSIQNRNRFGHWEADLMAFSKPDTSILVTCERKSRRIVLCKQNDKTSQTVIDNIASIMTAQPEGKRLSCTFDNGPEFTKHYMLRQTHGLKTWFCDPRSPWQKGSVENAIGRLRRFLPRKMDTTTLTNQHMKNLENAYNNTPRKCLGFKTPNEVFFNLKSTVALQT